MSNTFVTVFVNLS